MRTTTFFCSFRRSILCQNYRPFEWGLRHTLYSLYPLPFGVRITVHLNEDYDKFFLYFPYITIVRITVHLNEDYDDISLFLKLINQGQNYRPFEWGLRLDLNCSTSCSVDCQNYRPFEWGLRQIIILYHFLNHKSELPSIWMRTTTSFGEI